MRFSMEGYIRPFLAEYPDETLATLTIWADDPNYHVRRLVSEGTRPMLPWAPRIPIDVESPIPMLDKLHADPTRYVTRSVANHLNDISKINPELAISTSERWQKAALQNPKELTWMTRHALRTLIKSGDPSAMQLLGYSPNPVIDVDSLDVRTSDGVVRIGEVLEFGVTITAKSNERLLVDYVIDFVKKNGSTRPQSVQAKADRDGQRRAANTGKEAPTSGQRHHVHPLPRHTFGVADGQRERSGKHGTFELVE